MIKWLQLIANTQTAAKQIIKCILHWVVEIYKIVLQLFFFMSYFLEICKELGPSMRAGPIAHISYNI